jgi:hypothetical protein
MEDAMALGRGLTISALVIGAVCLASCQQNNWVSDGGTGQPHVTPTACDPDSLDACPEYQFVCTELGGNKRCESDAPAAPDDGDWTCTVQGDSLVCRGSSSTVPDADGWTCQAEGSEVVCSTPLFPPDDGSESEWNCHYEGEILVCVADDGGDTPPPRDGGTEDPCESAEFLPPEICGNGLDDDCDLAVDCDDSDCICDEHDCGDAEDNDGDGLADCADSDCACSEFNCIDGIDNDLDGLADCRDPDCVCTENCFDGIDNDGDGQADCRDSDCACTEDNCGDGVDNDADGTIDCRDTDCACTEDNCGDGVDNDADGAVDCSDTDCTCVEVCGNGLDDDRDGAVDWADSDCGCPPGTECCDGFDNDGDGGIDEGNVCEGVGEPCPPGAYQACDCYCGVHRRCRADGTWGPCLVDSTCTVAGVTSQAVCAAMGLYCDFGMCTGGWGLGGMCWTHTDCPDGQICDLGYCVPDPYMPWMCAGF